MFELQGCNTGKLKIIILFLLSGLCSISLKAQDIAPQIWNNTTVVWNINEHFTWRNSVAYNVLLSSEFPWDEFALTSVGAWRFKQYFEATLGVYSARTRQTVALSSYELRPFVGFRVHTNNQKRWLISNLSRFETRQLFYSDVDHTLSFRFRNQTYAGVSLNQKSLGITKNNLVLFGYFEAFVNPGKEVRERFFNQFKYKLGLAFRLNSSWGFNLGVIYQDAKNNVGEAVQLPTTLITNYIVDWGVIYVIGPKKHDQK
jgi:hypothetical protein